MIYVDDLFEMDPLLFEKNPRRFQAAQHGKRWCHMWHATGNVEELVQFAVKIGLKAEWLQRREGFPHFDLVPSKRVKAIIAGAVAKPLREWLQENCGKAVA